MLENTHIREKLQKAFCPKCGASLEGAIIVPITSMPIASVVHTTCAVCKTQSMVTITHTGSIIMPVQTDLMGDEFNKFLGTKPVGYDELLDLHVALKKEKLWKLLQKKEKNSEKD